MRWIIASALCTLMPLMQLTSTHLGSSRLHTVGLYAVYDSWYDNHPLSQKLDPRLNAINYVVISPVFSSTS